MRIFLTGGTGYIGQVLARRLAEAGHEVRALVRPTSDAESLRRAGAATFTGDIGDRYSLREGMSGADWVIHAAAELDFDAPAARMRAANVLGTENVASLAYKLGTGRFLHVSSIAAFGGIALGAPPATEETPPLEPFPTLYSATKAGGERAVREWAKRGLRVNVVYPSLVYGPPGKRRGSNVLLRSLIRRRMPALVGADRRTTWVYLDDVVDGILRVIGQAPPGRDYLLTGDVATVRELAERVAALAGVGAPRLDLPVGLARALAGAAGPLYRLAGRRPPFSSEQVASLTREWAFDDSRARRELGWRPRGLAEGLPPTVEFLRGD